MILYVLLFGVELVIRACIKNFTKDAVSFPIYYRCKIKEIR